MYKFDTGTTADANGQYPILDSTGTPTSFTIDGSGKIYDTADPTKALITTMTDAANNPMMEPDGVTPKEFELQVNSSTGKLSVVMGSKTYPLEGDTTTGYTITVNGKSITIDDTALIDSIYTERVQDGTTDKYSPSNQLRPIVIPTDAQSMSVGQDGTVQFVDKNGELQWAGQLQLAKFPNPGGLQKVGSNYFQQTANSGQPLLAIATESGMGSVNSGFLEMSNVDLSEEFTDMIVAQRGFQANTRIITTSDSILEELINLKR
jgi:flagellar hook protein FlgE